MLFLSYSDKGGAAMDVLASCFNPELIKQAAENNPFIKLNDQVYRIIEQAILTGKLSEGTKLSTVRIAELLDVSRTPVSDALEQLLSEGLVVSKPGRRGYFVFDISHASLEHLFMARRALEGTASYICASTNIHVDLQQLRNLAVRFRDSFKTKDFACFSQLDQDFHKLILRSCGNPYLQNLYERLNRFIRYYSVRSQEYLLFLKDEPAFATLACQHMSIYRAIEMGMPVMAESASNMHIETCFNLSMRYHGIFGNISHGTQNT